MGGHSGCSPLTAPPLHSVPRTAQRKGAWRETEADRQVHCTELNCQDTAFFTHPLRPRNPQWIVGLTGQRCAWQKCPDGMSLKSCLNKHPQAAGLMGRTGLN